MLQDFIIITCFLLVFLFFHELGHIISAKIISLNIYKVGFTFTPYPHVYVAVEWTPNNLKRYIYLFSGILATIILFLISYWFNFFYTKLLIYSFIIQFILETNPFYSDFVIANITNEIKNNGIESNINSYKKIFNDYIFSIKWYIHFIIWMLLILFLIKKYHLILL